MGHSIYMLYPVFRFNELLKKILHREADETALPDFEYCAAMLSFHFYASSPNITQRRPIADNMLCHCCKHLGLIATSRAHFISSISGTRCTNSLHAHDGFLDSAKRALEGC